MTTQPEALRLADLIQSRHGNDINDEAAAELRRLHAENEAIHQAITDPENQPSQFGTVTFAMYEALLAQRDALLLAQRDALLEALKLARSIIGHPDDAHTQMIDAAIKAVEEGK